MADALIKIATGGGQPPFEDGDIIGVYPDCCILFKNAELVCGANRFGTPAPRAGILRPAGTLEQLWYERTHRYRHERVSKTEIMKVDLWGLEPAEIRRPPGVWAFNSSGQRVLDGNDLDRMFARRLRNNTHNIFGPRGRETFYRGPVEFSNARMSHLWDGIEPVINRSRSEFMRMPFGRMDRRVHLCVTCDDMTDADAAELTRPDEEDVNGDRSRVILRRQRRVMVPWEDTKFGLTERQRNDAKNRGLETDERDAMRVRLADIEAKPARARTG